MHDVELIQKTSTERTFLKKALLHSVKQLLINKIRFYKNYRILHSKEVPIITYILILMYDFNQHQSNNFVSYLLNNEL